LVPIVLVDLFSFLELHFKFDIVYIVMYAAFLLWLQCREILLHLVRFLYVLVCTYTLCNLDNQHLLSL